MGKTPDTRAKAAARVDLVTDNQPVGCHPPVEARMLTDTNNVSAVRWSSAGGSETATACSIICFCGKWQQQQIDIVPLPARQSWNKSWDREGGATGSV